MRQIHAPLKPQTACTLYWLLVAHKVINGEWGANRAKKACTVPREMSRFAQLGFCRFLKESLQPPGLLFFLYFTQKTCTHILNPLVDFLTTSHPIGAAVSCEIVRKICETGARNKAISKQEGRHRGSMVKKWGTRGH